MRCDAVVFRNPRQRQQQLCIFSARFRIFYIIGSTHETYRSTLSKRKTTHSGVGGKKQSNNLAVTPAHISWCLSPGIYGSFFFGTFILIVQIMILIKTTILDDLTHCTTSIVCGN